MWGRCDARGVIIDGACGIDKAGAIRIEGRLHFPMDNDLISNDLNFSCRHVDVCITVYAAKLC